MIKLSTLHENPKNPRTITDAKFEKLKKSVLEFADKMMPLRPIIVDNQGMVIAGNMRYKALVALGREEVPDGWVKNIGDMTAAEVKRFVVADNLPFGEWDFKKLSDEWGIKDLCDWGMEKIDFGFSLNAKDENIEVGENIPEYISFVVTENEKEFIESRLNRCEGTNRTEQLLDLCKI
jgi:hypothetical protein